ncbi:MAG TPA: hypothetical protein VIL46_01210, partial [Gemmataceae bacterium]
MKAAPPPHHAWGSPTQPPATPKRPWYRRWWAITLLALAGLLAIGSLLPGEEQPATTVAEPSSVAGTTPGEAAGEGAAPATRPAKQPAQGTPTIGQPA